MTPSAHQSTRLASSVSVSRPVTRLRLEAGVEVGDSLGTGGLSLITVVESSHPVKTKKNFILLFEKSIDVEEDL